MILFNAYSFNSLCVNCFNSSFNWMHLSLLGFNTWYLWLLKFTMYALLLTCIIIDHIYHILLMK